MSIDISHWGIRRIIVRHRTYTNSPSTIEDWTKFSLMLIRQMCCHHQIFLHIIMFRHRDCHWRTESATNISVKPFFLSFRYWTLRRWIKIRTNAFDTIQWNHVYWDNRKTNSPSLIFHLNPIMVMWAKCVKMLSQIIWSSIFSLDFDVLSFSDQFEIERWTTIDQHLIILSEHLWGRCAWKRKENSITERKQTSFSKKWSKSFDWCYEKN